MRTTKIQRECEEIRRQITLLKSHLTNLQSKCKHKKATKIHKSDTGNWCPQDDCYWTEFDCPECGKRWTEEGSK